MAGFEIRAATPDDAPAIWRILKPIIRAGETYALNCEMTEEDALSYWCAPEKHSFVATDRGAVIGTYFLRANQAGGGAHVANAGYATAVDATGRGVARAMCRHSLDFARALGFRAMQFNFVVSSNSGAVGLWQSLGFEVVGRVPEAFAHPLLGDVAALTMHRRLDPVETKA